MRPRLSGASSETKRRIVRIGNDRFAIVVDRSQGSCRDSGGRYHLWPEAQPMKREWHLISIGDHRREPRAERLLVLVLVQSRCVGEAVAERVVRAVLAVDEADGIRLGGLALVFGGD